ncbi:hypothetical protein [Paenibacillus macerans]|uniref:hypothetical protein n=1 Tax=Paenibacillus macerans TaxID=44252 RepID=UPI00203E94C0|nr:hypothetical protein [Paenibacillus macerans]MCM3698378.1 hypothetical protein [Paenibacillus macerans]
MLKFGNRNIKFRYFLWLKTKTALGIRKSATPSSKAVILNLVHSVTRDFKKAKPGGNGRELDL